MKKIFLTLISTSGLFFIMNGQGCSDAGFCTMDAFQPENDSVQAKQNQIKVGFSYGTADHSISVMGAYLEYHRQFSDTFGAEIKLTSLGQSGNDISTFGISDIYLNGTYKATPDLSLTAGVKIPLTSADKTENNLPLPMDYQASLGTFDLILGVGYSIKKLQLVAAYQQPLSQNKNQFFSEIYPLNSDLRNFQSTNDYKRKGDILLRVSYLLPIGDKFTITPSILPIFHLGNDTYTNLYGVEQEIDGSSGLTLNGNIYFDYKFNSKNALQLNVGAPFVTRDVRPDGLTRKFIANLEYSYSF